MQLRTVGGKLTLGSVYKVVVWGWLIGWGVFMIPVFLAIVLVNRTSALASPVGERRWTGRSTHLVMLPAMIAESATEESRLPSFGRSTFNQSLEAEQ